MRKTINHLFAIAATAMLLNLPQSCSMDENMHNSHPIPILDTTIKVAP